MSMENVKKFYELAEKDVDLVQKLASLDSEMSLEASDLANLKDIINEKIIPLAKEKGLNFTAEEMVEFANEKYLQLSENDLLDVSGGVSPKAAALGLSSVLMLSLGSAAAINLMNSNHDNISNVVSESAPSKSRSESEAELDEENEEAIKKSLDEMMKKSPKGADKNADMEDIEKELDKLFKGGKLDGGSAFRPGKGRTAGKNMLNRTIGKKGTSDFDFDKFLKELDDELAKEAATSQAAKPKATTSETSNFDLDKFMEEINSEKKPETGASPLEAVKPAPTAPSERIEETTKPVPTSKGTPKKIEKTKEQVEAEKKQAQQQVDKRLADFKTKFETSFKETFKTQCDDEDLKAFVQEYLATPGNLDGAMVNGETTVKFYQGYVFSKGSATASTDLLAFAKELNETLPKATYKAQYSIFKSWKNIMSPVMEALRNVKYDINKFDDVSRDNMIGDINNIYNKIHELGYLPGHSEYGRSPESNERKTLEVLRALKESNYNKDNAKVQAALKALSGGEIKEKNVKKPDASGVDQARREREKKEDEEKAKKEKEEQERKQREEEARKQKEAAQQIVDKLASAFKLTVQETFNKFKTQLTEAELQQFVSEITGAVKSDETMQKAAIVEGNLVKFFAKGQLKDGTAIEASKTVNVFELAKELNEKLPKAEDEKPLENTTIFDSQEAAQKKAKDSAASIESKIKTIFAAKNFKTKLSNKEVHRFIDELDDVLDGTVEDGFLPFVVKGHLPDGTPVEVRNKINLLNLVNELNDMLPPAASTQEKLVINPIEKPNAGAKVTTAKELQQQAEQQVGLARTELDKKFQAKIKANNGIELNEANLNKLISETLDNYSKENEKNENVIIDDKNGTITFTAKGTIPGAIWGIKAGVGSVTLNVRDFFTKLNNEATEDRRESERSSFVHTQYVTATEFDVTGGLKLARETAKKMIQEEFNKIIVEKYNKGKSAKKATSVADIPAGKMATIVKSLNLNEVISKIVMANIERTHDFKDPDKEKYEGSYSIKTAPLNEELKIGAIGYRKTGLLGTSTELIKYGDEISTRSVVQECIESYTVNYKTVVGQNADKEAEALYKFLTDNKLVENGTVVEDVHDAIKDSDKEQFKKDVKHIADQISGSEGKYTLSGKWRSYNVAQEKLKAIKDLAKQLGN